MACGKKKNLVQHSVLFSMYLYINLILIYFLKDNFSIVKRLLNTFRDINFIPSIFFYKFSKKKKKNRLSEQVLELVKISSRLIPSQTNMVLKFWKLYLIIFFTIPSIKFNILIYVAL